MVEKFCFFYTAFSFRQMLNPQSKIWQRGVPKQTRAKEESFGLRDVVHSRKMQWNWREKYEAIATYYINYSNMLQYI